MNLAKAKKDLIAVATGLAADAKSTGVSIVDAPEMFRQALTARDDERQPLYDQIANLEAQIKAVDEKHAPTIGPLRELTTAIDVVKKLEGILGDDLEDINDAV